MTVRQSLSVCKSYQIVSIWYSHDNRKDAPVMVDRGMRVVTNRTALVGEVVHGLKHQITTDWVIPLSSTSWDYIQWPTQ